MGGPVDALAAGDLEVVVEWSIATLDTRGGGERRDAPPRVFDAETLAAALAVGQHLGLVDTPGPQRTSYDLTVVLGGTATGNRRRTGLTAEMADAGVDIGTVVALASNRPISASEHKSDPDSVQDRHEWSNLLRQMTSQFGPLRAEADAASDPSDRQFRGPSHAVRSLVAPDRANGGRPSTVDALQFLLERVPGSRGSSALLVTSAIYVPYQFFAGAPVLLAGGLTWVEMVGTATATDGDQNLLTQRILQEVHAGLSAVKGLTPN